MQVDRIADKSRKKCGRNEAQNYIFVLTERRWPIIFVLHA